MLKYVLLLCATLSVTAMAAAPKYDLRSSEIYGKYEGQPDSLCTDETGRPCVQAVVKNVNGKAVVVLDDIGEEFELRASRSGRVTFKWENPEVGDCDDPGCGNLIRASGVIYPKKSGRSYVPAMKVFITRDYPFPDEEDAPEGEATQTQTLNKR